MTKQYSTVQYLSAARAATRTESLQFLERGLEQSSTSLHTYRYFYRKYIKYMQIVDTFNPNFRKCIFYIDSKQTKICILYTHFYSFLNFWNLASDVTNSEHNLRQFSISLFYCCANDIFHQHRQQSKIFSVAAGQMQVQPAAASEEKFRIFKICKGDPI